MIGLRSRDDRPAFEVRPSFAVRPPIEVGPRPVETSPWPCACLSPIPSRQSRAFESNSILYHWQHGFRSRRSCDTQLVTFTDDLYRNMESGTQTDVVVLDFSKAFDKVSHPRLLEKIEYYGIRDRTSKWISAFLSNRSQRVVIDGETSDWSPVESGVPQGSVLGPALFLLYINDLPDEISSHVRLFADDAVIYRPIHTTQDCHSLQQDIDKLTDWENLWKMNFNTDKCNILRLHRKRHPIIFDYHMQNSPLTTIANTKYLGITFSENLTWKNHINNITTKASKTLGFIKRNLKHAPQKTKSQAYTSLVRPQLEYAAPIWDPSQQNSIHKIESVQRRAARFVTNDYSTYSSVTAMLTNLNWPTLQDRRSDVKLVLLYKTIHNLVAIPASYLPPFQPQQSRNSHPFTFQRFHTRTQYYADSFFPSAVKLWNTLPATIATSPTLDIFKARLSHHSP